MKWLGIAFGLFGALVGAYSVWFGLTKEPNSVALALVALALAIIAGVLPLVLYRRPLIGGTLMLVCGGAGYMLSIFILPRTLYFVALGCWIVGAALLLLAGRATSRAAPISKTIVAYTTKASPFLLWQRPWRKVDPTYSEFAPRTQDD